MSGYDEHAEGADAAGAGAADEHAVDARAVDVRAAGVRAAGAGELETRAVRAGREELRTLGVGVPPLDLSATYPLYDIDRDGEAYDAWAAGEEGDGNPIYARFHSPTVARFERGLAQLEGAEDAAAFASGMAAVTASLLACCQQRRHVVAVRPLYGGTDHLLACGLLGLEVSWAAPDGVGAAVRADTGLVIVENPQNPVLSLVDIADVVRQAGSVPVLVDNTFATPILQSPLAHGAAFSLHSASKFLGGHGDVLAGVVAASAERAAALRRVRMYTGAVLHPLAAYLLHRGLPTLPMRVERAQATAAELARRMGEHPAVERVHYPGLDGEPLPPSLRGPGCLLAFDVHGGGEAARRFVAALRLVSHAVSLGGVDTLLQHPASFAHRLVEPDVRDAAIPGSLLRMAVGLEHVEDLWGDVRQALDVAVGAAVASTHV